MGHLYGILILAFGFLFICVETWRIWTHRSPVRGNQAFDPIPGFARHGAETWKATGQRKGRCYLCGKRTGFFHRRTLDYLGYAVRVCEPCFIRSYRDSG